MKFRNGSKWAIDAPTEDAGHGGTLGLTIGDEIFAQRDAQLEAALMPATTAVPDAQSLWISTVGETKTKSPFLWKKAEAGRARVELVRADPSMLNVHRTMYVEYSAPEDADPDDPRTWWGCMPALGYTTTERKIAAFRESMQEGFLRPFLNWWGDDFASEWKIPSGRWDLVQDAASKLEPDPLLYVFDVAPDSAWASISVAGVRADGRMHIEVVADGLGTDWLVDGDPERELPGLRDIVANDPGEVWCEHKFSGFLIPAMQEAGIDVQAIPASDALVSGPGLLDAVLGGNVRHIGQAELTDQLASAATMTAGESWKWSRGKSMRPITGLVSASLALRMLSKRLPELAYDPMAILREGASVKEET